MKSLFPFQNLHKIAFHIDVNVAVAVEGTAGHVAAGDLIDWNYDIALKAVALIELTL